MSKRKGRVKGKKLSRMEVRLVEMARDLLKTNDYDPDRDWGGVCLTFVSLRPQEASGTEFLLHRSGYRVATELHEEEQPVMSRAMDHALGLAMAHGATKIKERVDRSGGTDYKVDDDVTLPKNVTDQMAREIVGAEIARRGGKIQ